MQGEAEYNKVEAYPVLRQVCPSDDRGSANNNGTVHTTHNAGSRKTSDARVRFVAVGTEQPFSAVALKTQVEHFIACIMQSSEDICTRSDVYYEL